MSNKIGVKIKKMRLEKEWTQKELASALGLKNETAIANYESGYSVPKDEVKLKLCDIFNCSMDYLMGKSNYKNIDDFFKQNQKAAFDFVEFGASDEASFWDLDELEHIINVLIKVNDNSFEPMLKGYISTMPEKYRARIERHVRAMCDYARNFCNEKAKEPNQYVLDLYNSLSSNNQLEAVRYMRFLKASNKTVEPKIQILGQTAAGKPIEYGDSYAQDVEDISNIPDNADYALVVNGDSMEPLIKNGQLIYVRECPDVENGTIAIVEIDGAVTCKKVYKWNDHIELQSLNTAYEPIIITAGNFKILGKVIL